MTAPHNECQPEGVQEPAWLREPTPAPWAVSEVRTVEGEYMVVGGTGQGFGLIACCPMKADAELICRLRGSGVQSAPLLLPTPEQIEPILDDFLGVDSPHYEELRRRCAQRIFDLCAVMSGLPIKPSDGRVADDSDLQSAHKRIQELQGENDVLRDRLAGGAQPPRQPTEAMLTAARDWSALAYGKPIGNMAATACWHVMFDASTVSSADEASK